VRDKEWKYVEVEGGEPLLFHLPNDPDEVENLAGRPEHAERCQKMKEALFRDFSWEGVHEQLAFDRARLPAFMSGMKPTTPNQYMLPDGRIFDAEKELYDARWIRQPDDQSGGIIPQRFG
jgi:choline-sulfatase